MLGFKLFELPHQTVVLPIADDGSIQDIIEVLVTTYLVTELFDVFVSRLLLHSFDNLIRERRIATYQNTVLIYNPAAGKLRRDPDGIINRCVRALATHGIQARPIATTGPQTAGDIARKAIDADADLLLALGGDGTINEIVNGMVGSRVPLGILPAGTANVLAMELGLGSRLDRAIPKLAQSVPERIALGQLHNHLGSRYFVLMAGAGLDAEIVYNINLELKRALGKIAYWIGGFSHIVRPMAQFEASVDSRPARVGFMLASRVRNYGGDLEIATGANLLEDEFEVVLFSGRNPLRYAVYFTAAVLRVLARVPGITIERTRQLELSAPSDRRIYVQLDGEYAGRLPATLEIVPDALTLMVPADFRERLGLPIAEALMPAAG